MTPEPSNSRAHAKVRSCSSPRSTPPSRLKPRSIPKVGDARVMASTGAAPSPSMTRSSRSSRPALRRFPFCARSSQRRRTEPRARLTLAQPPLRPLRRLVDLLERLHRVQHRLHRAGVELLLHHRIQIEVLHHTATGEHTGALPMGADQAAAVHLQTAVLADEPKLHREPEDPAHPLQVARRTSRVPG